MPCTSGKGSNGGNIRHKVYIEDRPDKDGFCHYTIRDALTDDPVLGTRGYARWDEAMSTCARIDCEIIGTVGVRAHVLTSIGTI